MERSRRDERDGDDQERNDLDALARQVAELTGETPEQALRSSLRERLQREEAKVAPKMDAKAGRPLPPWDQAAIDAIVARCAALPVLDPRSADEILGYDENGLPT